MVIFIFSNHLIPLHPKRKRIKLEFHSSTCMHCSSNPEHKLEPIQSRHSFKEPEVFIPKKLCLDIHPLISHNQVLSSAPPPRVLGSQLCKNQHFWNSYIFIVQRMSKDFSCHALYINIQCGSNFTS